MMQFRNMNIKKMISKGMTRLEMEDIQLILQSEVKSQVEFLSHILKKILPAWLPGRNRAVHRKRRRFQKLIIFLFK